MPAYPYQRITNIGGRPGSGRQMPPDVFFELEPEQIVNALVNQGYSKKEAEKEVEAFLDWKAKSMPQQVFADDAPPAAEQAESGPEPYRGFFGAVARMKGKSGDKSGLTGDNEAG